MNSNDNGSTAVKDAQPHDDHDATTIPRRRNHLLNAIALSGLVLSLVAGIMVDGPTLWGLLPIALYAVLALLGMDIMVATVVAIVSAFLILLPAPDAVADVLGESVGDQITIIGLIIMLGAGLAEVLRATGVAGTIVHAIMRTVGEKNKTAVTLGMMLSCLILVAALGTLAGALAIAVPLLLPIAARMGFTRSATASMIFIGGCAGLALAPFAGSNVAIMDAAEVGYLQYLLYGAGPLAVLSLIMGLLVVPWMQRRTLNDNDFYDAEDLGALDHQSTPSSKRATAVFVVALLASIVYATITSAGTTFPLLALPVLAMVTGLAGGLTPHKIAAQIYDGAASLISVFLLFWLLAVLFAAINLIEPFQVILDSYGGKLSGLSPFVFALAIALLGWVGIPGATAAQVVLLDQVFGGLAASVGVGAGTWVVVLLFASKADTYGPFPNANMIGAMGLARSLNLRNMLITGWLMLIPSTLMYTAIIFFETR
ncbi:permease [Rhodococcus opacus M213]|uniref:Permease n=1 Tax=Rhodococcus opacus M213 TaxID=1129896 RepID=K8XLS0_RHOOP|nr:Na+/H+ antiporter NhaC family protein [Rhodococcus opacus]EKT82558.1 permease [Rhodococcus opacus M213]